MAYSPQMFIIVFVIAAVLMFRNSFTLFSPKIYARGSAQKMCISKQWSHYVYLPVGVYFTLLTFQVLSGGFPLEAPFM
jgi:hypothetical protein